jgi:D-serine deaminase-like pyridoxal phosphate-dependent protein
MSCSLASPPQFSSCWSYPALLSSTSIHSAVVCSLRYHRAGVDPLLPSSVELARAIEVGPNTKLAGIYSHSGNSYNTDSAAAGAAEVAEEERRVMSTFASLLSVEGVRVPIVSMGATPSTACAKSFEGVSEIHPGVYFAPPFAPILGPPSFTIRGALSLAGNYCFFDRQTCASGSCASEEISCFVACRVAGVYPARNEWLVDAGGVILSKDSGGVLAWGEVRGFPQLEVKRLSQEHGIIGFKSPPAGTGAGTGAGSGVGTEDVISEVPDIRLGTLLHILPNHSCMVAAAAEVLYVEDDEGKIVDKWIPCKGW